MTRNQGRTEPEPGTESELEPNQSLRQRLEWSLELGLESEPEPATDPELPETELDLKPKIQPESELESVLKSEHDASRSSAHHTSPCTTLHPASWQDDT